MERMRTKRLLAICLSLLLSVSMLPVGTFAEAEASGGDQKQTAAEQTADTAESADTDSEQTETEAPEVLPEEEITEPEADTDPTEEAADSDEDTIETEADDQGTDNQEIPQADPKEAEQAEEETSSVRADYAQNDGVEAASVEGEAAGSKSSATEAFKEDTDLSNKTIKRVVNKLFASNGAKAGEKEPRYPQTAERVEGYERQGDGSNIEEIKAEWVTSDSQKDNDDPSVLYLKPSGDERIDVRLSVQYSLSGEHGYAPGEVMITIPANLFKTRDGKDCEGIIIPYPQDPARNNKFNWKRIKDTYVLTNTDYIQAAAQGFFELQYNDLLPHEIVDMQESEPFTATIEILTHRNNVIALRSNTLTAQIDTEAIVTSANKKVSGSPQFVDASQIPEDKRVEGEKKYVVVDWYAWANTKANTEYYIDIVDTIPEEDHHYNGFLLGATTEDGNTLSQNRIYTGHSDTNTRYFHFKTAYPGSQFEKDTTYYFHNNVKFTLTEVDGPAELINDNVGPDPQKVTTASASAQTSLRYSDPKWKLPTGHFMVVKNGNDDKVGNNLTHHKSYNSSRSDIHLWSSSPTGWYGIYPSGMNDLQDEHKKSGENGSIRLSYTIDSVGYVMPWMFNGEWKEANESTKLSKNYDQPVTMVTEDTKVSLGRNGTTLELGKDYDLVSVEFPADPWIYTGMPKNINPDGSWAAIYAGDGTFEYKRDDDKTLWPDITLEIQRNGQWEKWAVASWKSGSFSATLADGSQTGLRVIDVPKDTENFRTIVTLQSDTSDPAVTKQNKCLQAAIDYDLRMVIDLKSTDKMIKRIEKAFENSNTPEMDIWNSANMKAYRGAYSGISDSSRIVDIDCDGRDIVRGYTTDTMVYPKKTATQTVHDVDFTNRTIKIHYDAQVEIRSFINDLRTWEQARKDKRLQVDEDGWWYDLLPKGVRIDESTIRVRDGDRIKDVEIDSDHYGGRTMVKVRVDLDPQPVKYKSGDVYYYEDVPSISFDAYYDFDAYKAYGENVHNVIGFETANDSIGTVRNYTGEPDDPYSKNNISTERAFIDKSEKDLMKDLDKNRDTPSFVYAGVSTRIDILAEGLTQLSKYVSVNNDNYWSEGTYYEEWYGEPKEAPEGRMRTVYAGGQYSYKLTNTNSKDSSTKNIVLFDSLENFEATNNAIGDPETSANDDIDVNAPRWHGTLRSVDTSQLERFGCAPVVYYSTKPNLQLSDESDPTRANLTNTNLKNSDIWIKSTDYKGELKDVKAIAIDASKKQDGSDFVLEAMNSITVLVNMKAPSGEDADRYISQKGEWGDSAHAYNNVYLTCTTIDDNTGVENDGHFVRHDYTKVGLKQYQLDFSKTWDDDDNRDGIRPKTVTFRLLANGKPAKDVLGYDNNFVQTLPREDVEEGEDPWSGVFDHILYTDDNGDRIHYTIEEDDADGYSSTMTLKGDEFYFRNVHKPEKVTVSGQKEWKEDNDLLRPEYITVELYKNGEFFKKQTVRPDSSGNWKYSFTDLYKYENGKEIEYTTKEILTGKGESYTPEQDGYDLKNTYHPYGDLVVSKETRDVTEASRDTAFPFTFTFTEEKDGEDVPVTKKFDYKIFEGDTEVGSGGQVGDGDVLEIRGGQRIEVYEIDERIKYKVTEGSKPGFIMQSSSGSTGTIAPNTTQNAEFINKYSAGTQLDLEARKTLENQKIKKYQFRFELYEITEDENGEEVETLKDVATNGAADNTVTDDDGTVTSSEAPVNFIAIKYTEADAGKTFRYRIKESEPGKPGYENYDKTIYEVEVEVTDPEGKGTLEYSKTYYRNGERIEEPEYVPAFRNEYKAEGSTDLQAWKALEGRDLTEGEFTFELVDETGKVLATTQNTADGIVLFSHENVPELNYNETQSGKTYKYYIREQAGENTDVTYDDKIFCYTVTVVDNEEGKLFCNQDNQRVRKVIDKAAGTYRYDKKILIRYTEKTGQHRTITTDTYTNNSHVKELYDSRIDGFVSKVTVADILALEDAEDDVNHTVSIRTTKSAASPENAISSVYAYTMTADKPNEYTESTLRFVWFEVEDEEFHYELVEDDADGPEFKNKLKPGGFAITKRVTDSPDADPDQEFRFRVRLIGNDLPESLEYEIKEAAPVNNSDTSNDNPAGNNASGSATNNNTNNTAKNKKEASDTEKTDNVVKEENQTSFLDKLYDYYMPATAYAAGGVDLSAYPEEGATVSQSGTFGTCAWELYSDGTFIFKPVAGNEGTMDLTGTSQSFLPWASVAKNAKRVRVDGTLHVIGSMDLFFWNFSAATDMDLKGFDVSKVTSMTYAFSTGGGAGSLEHLDVSGWNTSNVTSMAGMFGGDRLLTELDLTSFDTSKVTNMYRMFNECTKLTNLKYDPDKFDTSNVTSMAEMFYRCEKLSQLDVSKFNTSKVNSMRKMFQNCNRVQELDVSKFDTSKVTNMEYMFSGCNSVPELDVSKFNTSNVTTMANMFSSCTKINSLDTSGFDTSKVNNMQNMFSSCINLESVDVSSFNTSNVTNMERMFGWCHNLQEVDVSGFNTSKVTSMAEMFAFCEKINGLDVSGFDTSNVRNIVAMFSHCENLSQLDVSGFDTSKITDLRRVFTYCKSLTEINVNSFDTSNVVNMEGMFENCDSLTQLDVSKFDTTKVNYLNYMFASCDSLQTLDISSFDTSNVFQAIKLFDSDKKLSKVILSKDFSFNAGTGPDVLPTPDINESTGKWIREDRAFGPYTPEELRDNYTSEMAGTWIWEPKETRYTINFDGDGASGSMAQQKAVAAEAFVLPANKFRKPGHRFTGWKDETTGKTYMLDENGECIIPKDTYKIGDNITLKPIFEKMDTHVDLDDGVFEIVLHDGETAEFSDIPAGTSYKIEELTPDGWEIITPENGIVSGTIRPLITSQADFTNKYNPSVTQVFLNGSKMLDNETAKAGAFTFELYEKVDGSEDKLLQTKENADGGAITFDAIEYREADAGKTFKYLIKEKITDPDDKTITYDEHEEIVTVTVTKNSDGTLHAETKYDDDGIQFVNATSPGILKITKKGGMVTEQNKNDEFTFKVTLFNSKGVPLSDRHVYWYLEDDSKLTKGAKKLFNNFRNALRGEKNTEQTESGSFNVRCKIGETIVIPDIPAGSKYRIEETGIPGGWVQEGSVNEEGTIQAGAESEATINNKYVAAGRIVLEAEKKLSGGTPLEGQFTFELLDSEGKVIDTKTNEASGGNSTAKVYFDPITYNEDDIGQTYTYTIREVVDQSDKKIKYDEHEETVTVKIEDAERKTITITDEDGNEKEVTNPGGLLDVTAEYDNDGPLFTNELEKGSLELTKIAGSEAGNRDTEFEFKLDFVDGSENEISEEMTVTKGGETLAPIRSGGTVKLKAGEKVTVSEIPDGAEYTITETDMPGWKKTGSVNDSGTIAAGETSSVSFTNEYSADGDIQFNAVKVLKNMDLEENMFTFAVYDEEGEELVTAKNDADGNVVFPKLYYTYDDAGKTFRYTIAEIQDEREGIVYDATKYEVEVTVTDNGDGTLKTEATDNAQDMEFVNTLNSKGKLSVNGYKTFKYGSFDDGTFSFSIYRKDEFDKVIRRTDRNELDLEYTLIPVAKASTKDLTPDENGKVTFDFSDIEFELNDISEKNGGTRNKDGFLTKTYEFVVVEDIPGTAEKTTIKNKETYFDRNTGIVYDPVVHDLTVTVTETSGVTLDVRADSEENDFGFANEYRIEGYTVIGGEKKYECRDSSRKDSETFTFRLTRSDNLEYEVTYKDENGNLTEFPDEGLTVDVKATLNGDAVKFEFPELHFSHTGKYEFDVKEITDADKLIIFDDSEYHVVVDGTDVAEYTSEDGITPVYTLEGKEAATATFTNTKKAFGDLEVSKKAENAGKAEKDTEFSFDIELTSADGDPYEDEVSYTKGSEKGTLTPEDGVITIKLKAGEKSVFKDLPAGVKYNVKETDIPDRWTVTRISGSDGIIRDSEKAAAEFTNRYTPEEIRGECNILISKVNDNRKAISGAVFEVYRISKDSKTRLSHNDYSWLDSKDQFTVGKEAFRLTGLEDGTYEIKEVRAPEGYRIRSEFPIGFTIRDGKLIGDAIVLSSGAGYEMVSDDAHKFTIVNEKAGVKTGDSNNILIPLAVMLSAMLALLIIAERRRRKA